MRMNSYLKKCISVVIKSALFLTFLTVLACSSSSISQKTFEKEIDSFCLSEMNQAIDEGSSSDEIESVLKLLLSQAEKLNEITQQNVDGDKYTSEISSLNSASQDLVTSYEKYLRAVEKVNGDYDKLNTENLNSYAEKIDKANKIIKVSLNNVGTANCIKYTQ